MKRHKTHNEFKKRIFDQQFKLDQDYDKKANALENELEKGTLTPQGLNQLIEIYSVIFCLIYV